MRLYTLVYDGRKYVSLNDNRDMALLNIKSMLKERYGEFQADTILAENKPRVRKDCDCISFETSEDTKIW